MATLVDTHCHLNFDIFDGDRAEVIARATEQGISRILVPGIDIATSQSAVELANGHPGMIFAAVGIHPNEGNGWSSSSLGQLAALVKHKCVVAIGEIGLDFYRDHTPYTQQVEIFSYQLELAREHNLPVIIHNRNAMNTLTPLLEEWYDQLNKDSLELTKYPGVLHSFEGNEEEATRLLGMNFMVGLSGPITFKNALDKQTLVAKLPLDHIMTETDAPYLTPHPMRGRRNEPRNIIYILEKIALLQNQPQPFVADKIEKNASQLFKWGDKV